MGVSSGLRGRSGDDFGRAVSRILSAPCGGENHLSQQRYPKPVSLSRKRGAGRSSVSYLALHPMGFSVPRCLRFARCALTAPFHPYHLACAGWRFLFCGTFRRKAFRLFSCVYLRPNRSYAASRPTVFGLSSPACAGAVLRPSKISAIITQKHKTTLRRKQKTVHLQNA